MATKSHKDAKKCKIAPRLRHVARLPISRGRLALYFNMLAKRHFVKKIGRQDNSIFNSNEFES